MMGSLGWYQDALLSFSLVLATVFIFICVKSAWDALQIQYTTMTTHTYDAVVIATAHMHAHTQSNFVAWAEIEIEFQMLHSNWGGQATLETRREGWRGGVRGVCVGVSTSLRLKSDYSLFTPQAGAWADVRKLCSCSLVQSFFFLSWPTHPACSSLTHLVHIQLMLLNLHF